MKQQSRIVTTLAAMTVAMTPPPAGEFVPTLSAGSPGVRSRRKARKAQRAARKTNRK